MISCIIRGYEVGKTSMESAQLSKAVPSLVHWALFAHGKDKLTLRKVSVRTAQGWDNPEEENGDCRHQPGPWLMTNKAV